MRLTWQGRPAVVDDVRARRHTLAPNGEVTVVRTPGARAPRTAPATPWVWLTALPPSVDDCRRAVQLGAVDVICERTPNWARRLFDRLEELEVQWPTLQPPAGFVAESSAAQRLLRELYQAAQSSLPVLLTGETGSGKELAARLLHQWSARKARTFVPINCAAMPNELMEGELFGYAKGAFSGAVRDYDGLLSAGEGGTVFLDEIDDTPLSLQVKLLRVLEDRVVSRLGESTWRTVNFRILAATNRDLRPLIERGQFGADLYERLATLEVRCPPLRERTDDLPSLVQAILERYYREDARPGQARVTSVSPEALLLLKAYPWPGNVRELRNVIFGALVQKRAGDELLVSDLPPRLWSGEVDEPQDDLERRISAGGYNLRREVEALERSALRAALALSGGTASKAATLLGEVGHGKAKDPGSTVRRMMQRLGVTAPR